VINCKYVIIFIIISSIIITIKTITFMYFCHCLHWWSLVSSKSHQNNRLTYFAIANNKGLLLFDQPISDMEKPSYWARGQECHETQIKQWNYQSYSSLTITKSIKKSSMEEIQMLSYLSSFLRRWRDQMFTKDSCADEQQEILNCLWKQEWNIPINICIKHGFKYQLIWRPSNHGIELKKCKWGRKVTSTEINYLIMKTKNLIRLQVSWLYQIFHQNHILFTTQYINKNLQIKRGGRTTYLISSSLI